MRFFDKSVSFFLVLFFTLCCVSAHGEYKKNNKAFEAGRLLSSDSEVNHQKAKFVLQDITGTSVEARFLLGWWLLTHERREKKNTGISLIFSAHHEHYRRASYFMIHLYREDKNNLGLKNPQRATILLKELVISSSEPLADDESILGKWLLKDDFIKNKKEAIYWLEKSIEDGNIIATSALAPLFTQGEEKDLVKAWCYSDLGGTAMAPEKHALENQMTPEQIEQAQQMSWAWQDAHHIHMPGYRGQESRIRWQVESD